MYGWQHWQGVEVISFLLEFQRPDLEIRQDVMRTQSVLQNHYTGRTKKVSERRIVHNPPEMAPIRNGIDMIKAFIQQDLMPKLIGAFVLVTLILKKRKFQRPLFSYNEPLSR